MERKGRKGKERGAEKRKNILGWSFLTAVKAPAAGLESQQAGSYTVLPQPNHLIQIPSGQWYSVFSFIKWRNQSNSMPTAARLGSIIAWWLQNVSQVSGFKRPASGFESQPCFSLLRWSKTNWHISLVLTLLNHYYLWDNIFELFFLALVSHYSYTETTIIIIFKVSCSIQNEVYYIKSPSNSSSKSIFLNTQISNFCTNINL